MLPTYYFYLNGLKFPKATNELEINKKKSREAWENKSRKGDMDTWKTQGTRHRST